MFTRLSHRWHRRKGAILVLAAVLLIVLFAFVSFTVDIGYITLTRTQLRTAVDSAALAGINKLATSAAAVRVAALEMGKLNEVAGHTLILENKDVEIGTWDATTRTFTVVADVDYKKADAVRVTGILNSSRNSAINLFFAPMMGHKTSNMQITAVATLGGAKPRDVMVVIDCSKSMEENRRMQYLRPAAQALVDEMMTKDRIGLTVYSYPRTETEWVYDWNLRKYVQKTVLSDDDDEITGYLEKPLTFTHSTIRNRIPYLDPGMYADKTNIGGGMRVGIEQLEANRRTDPKEEALVTKYLVLMTDGLANITESPGTSPSNSVTYYANLAKSKKIIVHGITLGYDADQTLIKSVSTLTGGTFTHVTDGDYNGLFEAYKKIGRGDDTARLVQ